MNSGVILAIGLALLVPLALSLLYSDGSWASFLLPATVMVAAGIVGIRAARPRGRAPEYVSNRDVYLSVTLAWTLAALLGGTPFLVEGTFHSLLDSSFEAMSGFTTTGATLLSDIEAETPIHTFLAEHDPLARGNRDRGPLRRGRAAARGRGGASDRRGDVRAHPTPPDPAHRGHRQGPLIIYLAISVAETVALLLAGMPLYDAVIHTFGTVATGGFSNKTASVGFYDSLAIEAIIGFFMVASGVSFSLYYLLYTRRRLERLARPGAAGVPRDHRSAASLFIWGILVLEGDYGTPGARL